MFARTRRHTQRLTAPLAAVLAALPAVASGGGIGASMPPVLGQTTGPEGPTQAQGSEIRGLENRDLVHEWRKRAWCLDPEQTATEWQAAWRSSDWTLRHDVFDALGRTPESALFLWRWIIAEHPEWRPVHEPAAMQDAIWHVLRLVQGQGESLAGAWVEGTRESLVLKSAQVAAWKTACEGLWVDPKGFEAWSEFVWSWIRPKAGSNRASWTELGSDMLPSGPLWGIGVESFLRNPDGKLPSENLIVLQPDALHASFPGGLTRITDAELESPETRFALAAIRVAQKERNRFVGTADVPEVVTEEEWQELRLGLCRWTDGEGNPLEGRPLSTRRKFVHSLAMLGNQEVGEMFWQIGADLNSVLSKADFEALGGERFARQDFLLWACESLPAEVSLARALTMTEEQTGWVFDALMLRHGEIQPKAWQPWLDTERPSEFRQDAVAALVEYPLEAEVRALLLKAAIDPDPEVVRLVFRRFGASTIDGTDGEVLHAAFLERDGEAQLRLLREWNPEFLPPEFRKSAGGLISESGRRDPVLLRAVSTGESDPAAWDTLWAAFETDFERARAEWTEKPGGSTQALAELARALVRVDRDAAREALLPCLEARLAALSNRPSSGVPKSSIVFSKAALALLGGSESGQKWLLRQRAAAEKWPPRLQVELALQLAVFGPKQSGAPDSDALNDWLLLVQARDYSGLGPILQKRWVEAVADRGGELLAFVRSIALDPKTDSSVRGAAYAALVRFGEQALLVQQIGSVRLGEELALVADALHGWDDPAVASALRSRIALSYQDIVSDGPSRELAEETLALLQIALARRGNWDPSDGAFALAAPLWHNAQAGPRRMRGGSVAAHWPSETALVKELASRGQLAALLESHGDRWGQLSGPFLLRLARTARRAGDRPSSLRLSRMAEAALFGEAPGPQWSESMHAVERLRFRLAFEDKDWPRLQWYALVLRGRFAAGGASRRLVEPLLGSTDWRVGKHPEAWLQTLWWQGQVHRSWPDDREGAKAAWNEAQRYVGRSSRARKEQERLREWIGAN